MEKKKIIVTSALPYVNNLPHLGTLVCVVSADVYTRYLKSRGHDVVSVLGTDEHGTTTEVKAMELGVTPKECCDTFFALHKEVYEWFNCNYDCFGRTSSEENKQIAQDIFKKLEARHFITELAVEQAYDPKMKKFLADRYVEGVCPKCGFEGARGDQCDNCSTIFDSPLELLDPKSKLSGETPIAKTSQHLFIDLPKISDELKAWVDERKKNWSKNAQSMTEAWFTEGLRPRAITRDLEWGVPVPKQGFENKVFYSWFDAPIGYIGITAQCRPDWQDWWMKPDNVELIQFMGKDNIPFHTILFPAFLIGTGQDWTTLHTISVNEYLNYEGGKFSKSRSIGVFGDDAMKTGIPADVWRYYLMVNRPENSDTEFSWRDFGEKNNNELVANVGNLVNRTLTFIKNFYDGKLPAFEKELEYSEEVKKITDLMENMEVKHALREIMMLSKKGNQYFQEQQPWKAVKEDKPKADKALGNLVQLIKDLAILLHPFMPQTSSDIFSQLGISEQSWSSLEGEALPKDHAIGEVKPLFGKVDPKQLDEFKKRFAGKREEKTVEEEQSSTFPLNLRVAKITEVGHHPDADKLYVLKLDLGSEERQLVAGLRPYLTEDELMGKHIVIVSNLKPAKLRGQLSQGMMLAADKGDVVVPLQAPNSQPGDQVFLEGEKDAVRQSQIKIDDFAKVEFKVHNKQVFVTEKKLVTETEHIQASIDDGAKVR